MSGEFVGVSEDVLHNILSRLPAKSFAAAACVSRCWNKACGQILSRPRLVSALSLDLSPHVAVEEVLEKVLCKPIRPHFAIAFVGSRFCLHASHHLITETLGSNTPVITTAAAGIIGKDVITNRFKEVKWDLVYDDDTDLDDGFNCGIVLVVGFVPGLKTGIVPLLHTKSEPKMAMVDKFVSDIQSYAISVSGDAKPVGIMLFGDHHTDHRPIIAEIDQKMPRETVIIGDANSYFLCNNSVIRDFDPDVHSLDAIGLVFVKDNQNYEGEIKFHVGISSGIMPCGPRLEVVAVAENEGRFSCLTAKSEDEVGILHASAIIETLADTIEDEFYALYIGVMREKMPNDGENPTKYVAFHELLDTEEEVFIVSGTGIKPGDSFFLYHSDSDTARSSCIDVYNSFNGIVNPEPCQVHRRRRSNNGQSISIDPSPREEEVFGGIVFTSSSRGEKFFGEPKMDCMPFRENFPRVPLAGTFCFAPFGRRVVLEEEEEENDEERCSVQVFSTVYLAMTYAPPALQ